MGGHTAATAYSLLRTVKVEIHIRQSCGTVLIKDATHPDVAGNGLAPVRRVFYNGLDHYQALVQLGLNPDGWQPAWEQPPPETYFKEIKKETPAFPSLAQAAAVGNRRKATDFDQPRPGKKGKKSQKADGKEKRPENATEPVLPAKRGPHPLTHCRIVAKTTPSPELRDDIMTDLVVYGVRPKTAHPHRKQEDLIKARARQVYQGRLACVCISCWGHAIQSISDSNVLVMRRSRCWPRDRTWPRSDSGSIPRCPLMTWWMTSTKASSGHVSFVHLLVVAGLPCMATKKLCTPTSRRSTWRTLRP